MPPNEPSLPQGLKEIVDIRFYPMGAGEFLLGFADGCAARQAVEDLERFGRQGEEDILRGKADDDLLPFLLPFFLVWAARHVVAAARGRPAPPAVVSRRASRWVIAVVLLFWVLRNIPVWPPDLLAPHELPPPPPPAEAVSAAR